MAGCQGFPYSFTTRCQEGLLTARRGAGHWANKETHVTNILDNQQPNERIWSDNLKEKTDAFWSDGTPASDGRSGSPSRLHPRAREESSWEGKGLASKVEKGLSRKTGQPVQRPWELRVLGVCKGMRRPVCWEECEGTDRAAFSPPDDGLF